jgi:uncharacterized protein YndB with AHSA1/START domain
MTDGKPSVTLVRRIKAPAQKIYEAWTDPVKLARWWAPPGIVAVLGVEADPRVGGAYRIRMRGADGVEYEAHGVYRELQPPEKLVFSWALNPGSGRRSAVTVALRADGAATELTLTHEGDADPATWAERHRGWSATLDRLEREFD